MKRIFLAVMIFCLVMSTALAYEKSDAAVLAYYDTFVNEDMDGYLAVSYLEHYSQEALQDKKEYLSALFDLYDTTHYELSELSVLEEGSYAYAEYLLTSTIVGNGEEFTSTEQMSMTLLYLDGWKVFQVTPTKVLLQNMQEEEEEPLFEETYTEEPKRICLYETKDFEDVNDFSLVEYGALGSVIGNDKVLKVEINNDEYYYHFLNDVINSISKTEEIDYVATLDGCTLQRIISGSDPMAEYNEGNIELKGMGVTEKIKTGLGKIISRIVGWFSPTPYELRVEAETGELGLAGRYTFIGPTSRGPGELYLGNGNAFATYWIDFDYEGILHLYARVADDAKHANGARNAVMSMNGEELMYKHVSANYQPWGWEYVGEVFVVKGMNQFIVTKEKTTSAAFVADSFGFFEEKQEN